MNLFINYLFLFLALFYIIFSLDDLIFDFYYFYFKRKNKIRSSLKFSDLDKVPFRLLAVLIPAWDESVVIEPMIENLISSINYPSSLFHIFIGTYPNDQATCTAVKNLSSKYPNVHIVINPLPGPTTKAQNLNYIFKATKEFEQNKQKRFAAFLIHDAEDVIHPTSFKLVNYLIYKHDLIQLPVFPLQPYPTFRSFFEFITSSTYADEFAENHYHILPIREATKAMVPSAGTGFVISHNVLDRFEGESLFKENVVTEDYYLSLYFKEAGINTYFFIGGVERLLDDGRVAVEYIATRELFPNSFHQAVRQKSRWIYGISFQSFSLRDVLVDKKKIFSFFDKLSLYRDKKAKFANLLTLPGYFLFIYILVSYFYYGRWIISEISFLPWIAVYLLLVMIERQIMRGIALKNVYGWRSAIAGCLIPPLLPLRMIWGNIINFFATISAWETHLFGPRKKRPIWKKTEHSYLPPQTLVRYKRRLGDLLLEKGFIEPKLLYEVLKEAKETQKPLGVILKENGLIPPEDLTQALSEVLKMGFVRLNPKMGFKNLSNEDLKLYKKYGAVPVVVTVDSLVIAVEEPLGAEAVAEIKSYFEGKKIDFVLAPSSDIREALNLLENQKEDRPSYRIGERLVEKGLITEDHLLEALRVQEFYPKPLGEILVEMGVIKDAYFNKIE
ncbi:phage adsorption protein NrfB [Patescibacteria group bacterium]|nr:phage adsorption protein NrfB [Patescibacteria group bacterium]